MVFSGSGIFLSSGGNSHIFEQLAIDIVSVTLFNNICSGHQIPGIMEGNMEIKYGEGLEFECDGAQQPGTSSLPLEKEEALRQIIRHGYRAPVSPDQQMTLTIAGKAYAIFNLSSKGVGIYLNSEGQFDEQTRLQGMVLAMGERSFVVEGTVVHLSSDGVHHLCGVELTSVPSECQDAILDYLHSSRSSLFSS